ncbi:hypothetical protein GA0070607_3236 [Micromonospora coriariae]|uniref:Uncharacterized protein n=1 Tax=Micromonospora coriariae TaxID=285665 RepID=A0A1C4W7D4_9ACTN|nr:hypothetical protein [Micromonospora coriariae]SCE92105.1 hypothetical protein GA0070607_3236 [Micromonospora coriariae]
MSGRRLGRLFGSLFILAAVASVVVANHGGVPAELHMADVIWV